MGEGGGEAGWLVFRHFRCSYIVGVCWFELLVVLVNVTEGGLQIAMVGSDDVTGLGIALSVCIAFLPSVPRYALTYGTRSCIWQITHMACISEFLIKRWVEIVRRQQLSLALLKPAAPHTHTHPVPGKRTTEKAR